MEFLTRAIQGAAWQATPESNPGAKTENVPLQVREKIREKRKLRKIWQNTRQPSDKNKLNIETRNLKNLLQRLKNESIQNYLQGLSATEATDYSLWKATKRIGRPIKPMPPIRKENGEWARNDTEKAVAFAEHLAKVFRPHPQETTNEEEKEIHDYLETPHQMSPPIKKITMAEVKVTIVNHINPKKAPGYELITGRLLREIPEETIRLITMIFNSMTRIGYFPSQWKIANIIVIPKPGKPPEEVQSYRPISLLPMLSKVFEKLLLKRLRPIIRKNKLIPNHQFGFRPEHATIEQVHRVTNIIRQGLEKREFCSVAFLDISQAFDKVWHTGLLYKLKQFLPHTYFNIIKSYLTDRYFLVKFQEEQTTLTSIASGVPQGSVLGPILYLLYTSDLPTHPRTNISTFADDTAILATSSDARTATHHLQENVQLIETWLKKWRIKANEKKSAHVTFTLKRDTCPPITLNNQIIPQVEEAKYLGMHLDRKLTWRKHIEAKKKQLNMKLRSMYWLIGRHSTLPIESKLLIYKLILKPIWTYGIQLWGTASTSNIEIIQIFQNKALRMIAGAPKYVPNVVMHKDLQISTVRQEIAEFSKSYQTRLRDHPNILAVNLLNDAGVTRRLNRCRPLELSTRFSE